MSPNKSIRERSISLSSKPLSREINQRVQEWEQKLATAEAFGVTIANRKEQLREVLDLPPVQALRERVAEFPRIAPWEFESTFFAPTCPNGLLSEHEWREKIANEILVFLGATSPYIRAPFSLADELYETARQSLEKVRKRIEDDLELAFYEARDLVYNYESSFGQLYLDYLAEIYAVASLQKYAREKT